MTTRFPARPPRLRMLAVAVALLAVALLLAVGSVVALWAVVASNRRTLRDQDVHVTKLAGQVTALEAQVRGLGDVPVTRSTTTTTTTGAPGRATTSAAPSKTDRPDTTTALPTSTTAPPTTVPSTTTTTTRPCLTELPVGCVLPAASSHPRTVTGPVVRSAATTTIGRNP